MYTDFCSICLNNSIRLKHLNMEDENKKSLFSKLKEIEPNQLWHEEFSICEKCEILLNNTYDFKCLITKNDLMRKQLIQKFFEEYKICDDLNIDDYFKITDTDEVSAHDDYIDDVETNVILKESGSETAYSCFKCTKNFMSKSALACHISTKHGNVCDYCTETFRNKKELQSHRKKEHDFVKEKLSKFVCEICSEPFSLLKDILGHCQTVHNMDQKQVKPYWCDICDNKFSSSTLLMQHKKYHNGDRIFTCITCGKSFITKRDLSGHEKLHGNKRSYSCDKCDKTFNTSQNLWTHTYVVHTDASEWKYSCTMCSKRFAMKSNYNEHLQRHQGIKDHSCHICKKHFTTKPELQKHVKLHSNIAQWKCFHCQKTYRDKRSLKAHLAKAHGMGMVKPVTKIKKFVCHICPSQFFYKNKLQRHIRTHTGLKPFSCSRCDKKFTDKSYLTYHFKSVHNIINKNNIKEIIL